MLNQYLEKEQENRAVATLPKSTKHPEPPAEEYSGGWFDGLIGEKPRYPERSVYWSGYQQGLREYYANLAGIELPNDC